MLKRSLTVGLFSFVCLATFACDDDNDNHKSSGCEELKCDHVVGDGRSHICATINGQAKCVNSCLKDKEGPNDAICFSNGSLPPNSRPVYSAVDNCAKDDNGVLYSISTVQSECTNGCDAATGICKKSGENPDAECEALNCDKIVGGKVHICAKISGQASCKEACLGTAEGTNPAVCYANGSLPPDSRPVYSSVDTCAKDDNGNLYSVNVVEQECQKGCDEDTGLCNKDNQDEKCSLSCINDGGEAQVCVKLSGVESCKDICRGDEEGTNTAVCYENESLPPNARDQFSVVTVCAKDELGTLYATNKQQTKCDYGCNNTSGECNKEPEPTCEDLNCGAIAGDGLAHFCATIDGKAICKNECIGTSEGENPAICFSNGSLPPDARTFYHFVDICAKDDNGKLYSDSTQMDECPNGCYDNGECK